MELCARVVNFVFTYNSDTDVFVLFDINHSKCTNLAKACFKLALAIFI